MAEKINGAVAKGTWQYLKPINAVTATTTSGAIPIAGAKRITFLVTRANHSAGTTTMTVTVSLDGTTFVAYNKLVTNVANTNAEMKTRAVNVVLSANGTAVASMDLEHDVFKEMKVTATEGTDGTHTVEAIIEY